MENLARSTSLRELLPVLGQPSMEVSGAIDHILHAVRDHLGLDVAFVSEFIGDERILHYVDAAGWSPIHVGDSIPLDVGYCKRVVEGSLPYLIPDTREVPVAMALPETQSIPIGSHLSVPIRLANGRLYGTFCCFGFQPDQSLNDRDLMVMRAFADLATYQIEQEIECSNALNERATRVRTIIDNGGPEIVFQPIYRLQDMRFVGVECLSRFPSEQISSPEIWFADADAAGLGPQLEICAINKALQAMDQFPSDVYLAVNASPETLLTSDFESLFRGLDTSRIILEITEHAHVADYVPLRRCLSSLRAQGVRIAVDDAGAGYASLRHIINLQPDVIKLDVSLTRSIDSDSARRALAAALIEFGKQTDSEILAEGVETPAELNLLRSLGASKVQGFYMCPPLPLAQALQRLQDDTALSIHS